MFHTCFALEFIFSAGDRANTKRKISSSVDCLLSIKTEGQSAVAVSWSVYMSHLTAVPANATCHIRRSR